VKTLKWFYEKNGKMYQMCFVRFHDMFVDPGNGWWKMEQVGRTSGILQARARPKENQPFYRPTVLLEGVSQQDHQEQASYLGLNKKNKKKKDG